jgi:hypothetical protein
MEGVVLFFRGEAWSWEWAGRWVDEMITEIFGGSMIAPRRIVIENNDVKMRVSQIYVL